VPIELRPAHPSFAASGTKEETDMRFPITGHARQVEDTVQRAMAILKDRKDPAEKPPNNRNVGPLPAQRSYRPFR
jgi:hypothetical protein